MSSARRTGWIGSTRSERNHSGGIPHKEGRTPHLQPRQSGRWRQRTIRFSILNANQEGQPTPDPPKTLDAAQFLSNLQQNEALRHQAVAGVALDPQLALLRAWQSDRVEPDCLAIAGAIVGWLAGQVMNDRGGLVLNIVLGILGALIGGWLFGRPTINSGVFNRTGVFNLTALLVSFVGAVILLAIVHLMRRGRFR